MAILLNLVKLSMSLCRYGMQKFPFSDWHCTVVMDILINVVSVHTFIGNSHPTLQHECNINVGLFAHRFPELTAQHGIIICFLYNFKIASHAAMLQLI